MSRLYVLVTRTVEVEGKGKEGRSEAAVAPFLLCLVRFHVSTQPHVRRLLQRASKWCDCVLEGGRGPMCFITL